MAYTLRNLTKDCFGAIAAETGHDSFLYCGYLRNYWYYRIHNEIFTGFGFRPRSGGRFEPIFATLPFIDEIVCGSKGSDLRFVTPMYAYDRHMRSGNPVTAASELDDTGFQAETIKELIAATDLADPVVREKETKEILKKSLKRFFYLGTGSPTVFTSDLADPDIRAGTIKYIGELFETIIRPRITMATDLQGAYEAIRSYEAYAIEAFPNRSTWEDPAWDQYQPDFICWNILCALKRYDQCLESVRKHIEIYTGDRANGRSRIAQRFSPLLENKLHDEIDAMLEDNKQKSIEILKDYGFIK